MSVRIFVFLLFCFILQNSKVHASSASCYYEESDYHGYSCTLGITDSQDISSFTEINGDHLEGRSDDDVAGVWVYREVRTPDLPAFVCKRFKNLKNFFFQQLVLRELPEDAFADCKNILDITIQSKKYADTHMTKLPPNLLAGNPKLKIFEAELQELRTLSENFFANNPNLHKIALNTNRIRSLPANIFKPLINLEELSLSRNSLSKINPSWFETLTNLERLYLNENQISDIPKNAFAPLKNLKDLWISSNSIKVIHSDSFSQHPHLASINLVYNRINAIDEKFIDNIGIKSFQFTNMACAENQFVPESEDKTKLKEVLKTCFENYQPRVESATADDVEERFEVDEPTTPEPSGSPFDNVDGEKLLQEFLLIFGALKKQLEEAAKNETEN